MPFHRIAIINRGEPAMRLIRAVRDWNAEGRQPMETVALFTAVDRNAPYVLEADHSFELGSPAEDGQDEIARARNCYLNYDVLIGAMQATGADAAWPGWGFVSEHPDFAARCREAGITFIGPTPEAMRRVGDKIGSKRLAESAGVPVAPWSGGPVTSPEEALAKAAGIGFPLLVKATAGGGGRGIRFVDSAEALPDALRSASEEAQKAFGDGTVFLEAMVSAARHVEVQVLADDHDQIWAVGVRDCTAQRSHQKVIEEAPSPVLSQAQDQALREAAVRVTRASGYRNAGTAEFLFEPSTGEFCFMEMNARLQVEHPVTEMTTGLDLVKLQISLALGEPLPSPEAPATRGHAIEVRLCAEDPDRGFAPAPGRVLTFRPPQGAGLRIDAGIREGNLIPQAFDSMVAKIIALGSTREEARGRLLRGLQESLAVVEGGVTNRSFLIRLLEHPDFKASRIDTSWIDRLVEQDGAVLKQWGGIALAAVSILLHKARLKEDETHFFSTAARGRAELPARNRDPFEIRQDGKTWTLEVSSLGNHAYRVVHQDTHLDLSFRTTGPSEIRIASPSGQSWHLTHSRSGQEWVIEVNDELHRLSCETGGALRAPGPGLVLALPVAEGAEVEAGDRLVVLEAMKMEFPVTAPCRGRVRSISVKVGDQVETGSPLIVLESLEGTNEQALAASEGLVHPWIGLVPSSESELDVPQELRRLLLGYRPSEELVRRALKALPSAPSATVEALVSLLAAYWDLENLYASALLPSPSGRPRTSLGACLRIYLREVKEEGRGLPRIFVTALRRALGHYGLPDLEDTPNLRHTLFRIHQATKAGPLREEVIAGISRKLLALAPPLEAPAMTRLRAILDRACTQAPERPHQAGDLARQLRQTLFAGRIRAQRQETLVQRAETLLDRIQAAPSEAELPALVTELIGIPCSLGARIAARLTSDQGTGLQRVLEALIRRQHLLPLELPIEPTPGGCFTFPMVADGSAGTCIATSCPPEELEEALLRLESDGQRQREREVYLLVSPGAEIQVSRCLKALSEALPQGGPRTSISVPKPPAGLSCHVFEHGVQGWREVEALRGIHPALAHRLELWRLQAFDLDRLKAGGDNLLVFQARAHTSPADERFFLCGELLDLTPIRDAEGNLIELPELEDMILEAFHILRDLQAPRPAKKQLLWNRIMVHIRPLLQADRPALHRIAQRIQEHARGLGLEKVSLRAYLQESPEALPKNQVITFSNRSGGAFDLSLVSPHWEPMRPLDAYALKAVRARQRQTTYAYEILHLLLPDGEGDGLYPGTFTEFDFPDAEMEGPFGPVERPYGQNQANVVVGLIHNRTPKHPEGMARVVILGDSTREMGALAEPECRRVLAALDLAEQMGIPVEWFPISSGAKIAMDSGTENLDWTAEVLGRIIRFTQAGGEINLVVDGVNVGAQSYWNAEATMLMHTRGCLIMTPRGTMMLTGKRALEFSGSVAAEDNLGIGGFEQIMGPNGQAHYFAQDLKEACRLLFRYYAQTYIAPGETKVRPRPTADPVDRDLTACPFPVGSELSCIGDIWDDTRNPGRKKPFDIRTLMGALVDQDADPLPRWESMRDAAGAVVWDAHLGGEAITLVGIESRPLERIGPTPGDGPRQWSGGTLFPLSSKKVARALNVASTRRPVVFLANLSGFDGSPESLRRLQLEYGAEIGRAVANFKGRIVFCVIARYHGGAYVVFSRRLNPSMRVLALSGAYASVIGGAPAAAVVFVEEVRMRTLQDPRLEELVASLQAQGHPKPRRSAEYHEAYARIHAEKTHELAEAFDGIHTVQRALEVGSLDHILNPHELRREIIANLDCSSRA